MKISNVALINKNYNKPLKSTNNNVASQTLSANSSNQKNNYTTYPKNYYTINFSGLFLKWKNSYSPAFLNFVNKDGKVNQEEYLQTKLNNPNIIEEAKKYVEEQTIGTMTQYVTPDIMVRFAKTIKTNLDENFGIDKYKLIAVGTSVSAIAEILSNLGVDICYIPVSNVKTSYYAAETNNIDDIDTIIDKYCPKIYTAIDYLISRNEIPDDKDILLFDYTSSGQTLKTLRRAMMRRLKDNFGGKIYQIPVNAIDYSINKDISRSEFLDITEAMLNSSIYMLGNVPHFNVNCGVFDDEYQSRINNDGLYSRIDEANYKTDDELFEAFDKFSTPLARAYSLVCLDILNEEKSKILTLDF